MIQRIQSIFFLLASCSFGGFFGLPFATSSQNSGMFFEDGVYNVFDNPFLMVLTVIGILLSIVAIFMYKNRTLQQRLGLLGIIISIFLPLLAALLVYKEADNIGTSSLNDGMGIYLPVIIIILLALAIRFVKKDDQLVKSMDRLR